VIFSDERERERKRERERERERERQRKPPPHCPSPLFVPRPTGPEREGE